MSSCGIVASRPSKEIKRSAGDKVEGGSTFHDQRLTLVVRESDLGSHERTSVWALGHIGRRWNRESGEQSGEQKLPHETDPAQLR